MLFFFFTRSGVTDVIQLDEGGEHWAVIFSGVVGPELAEGIEVAVCNAIIFVFNIKKGLENTINLALRGEMERKKKRKENIIGGVCGTQFNICWALNHSLYFKSYSPYYNIHAQKKFVLFWFQSRYKQGLWHDMLCQMVIEFAKLCLFGLEVSGCRLLAKFPVFLSNHVGLTPERSAPGLTTVKKVCWALDSVIIREIVFPSWHQPWLLLGPKLTFSCFWYTIWLFR